MTNMTYLTIQKILKMKVITYYKPKYLDDLI